MASYLEKALTADEKIQYTGHISLWSLGGHVAGAILLLPLGIGLFWGLWAWIKYKSTELAITNKRIVAKFGFISRHTVEINLLKVESIQVSQSFWGRLFNFGSLLISGAGNPQAPIPGISNPMGFRKAFMETQEAVLNEHDLRTMRARELAGP